MPFTKDIVDFETYWRGNRLYESAFGEKAFSGKGMRVSGIKEIFKDYDIQLVLLDSYGVLNNMDNVIPSAVEAFAWMQEQGVPVHLVSNDARFHSHTRTKHYKGWGFNFSANEMVNSFDTLMDKVSKEQSRSPIWGAINMPVEHSTHEAWGGKVSNLSKGASIDEATDLTLLCTTPVNQSVRESVQEKLSKTGNNLWVGNPDVGVYIGENSYYVTPGGIAQSLTSTQRDIHEQLKLLGKPWPDIFLMAVQKFPDIAPENILMVGDTLHTDILGGNNLGFKTLLVESGVYTGQDTERLVSESGITPDYICEALKL
jgi:glycerol 3-phosphatase-2